MFAARCRHCDATVVSDTPFFTEAQYRAMRAHLIVACTAVALDMSEASVGELLKEYRVTQRPSNWDTTDHTRRERVSAGRERTRMLWHGEPAPRCSAVTRGRPSRPTILCAGRTVT